MPLPLLGRLQPPSLIVPGEVEIDWSHPLARGLCFYWVASAAINLADMRQYTTSGNVTVVGTPYGPGAIYSSASGRYSWPYPPIITSDGAGTGDFTMASIVNVAAGAVGQYFLSQRRNASPLVQANLVAGRTRTNGNSAGIISIQIRTTGTSTDGASTAAGITDGAYHLWSGVRSGTAFAIYKDGVDATANSGTSGATILDSAQLFAVGNLADQNATGITCNQVLAACWNRALSAQEQAWLYAEPFILLKQVAPRSLLWSIPSISTGTGALAAQAAHIAGAGTSRSTGTGALTDQVAHLAGLGTSQSTGTGALAGQVAQVVGAGTSRSTGAGALAAQPGSVAGAGTSTATGAGDLASQAVSVTGSGTSRSTGTGALAAQEASAEGVGASPSTGIGDLAALDAEVAGIGVSLATGAGALDAQATSVIGAGTSASTGTGVLAAQEARIAAIQAPAISPIPVRRRTDPRVQGAMASRRRSGRGALPRGNNVAARPR